MSILDWQLFVENIFFPPDADVPLKNPVNDASDLATTLSSLGFQVILQTNVNQQQMETAIQRFAEQIRNGDVALFYLKASDRSAGV